MKSFSAGFAVEKDRKAGIAPVWISKIVIPGTPLYISDSSFTVNDWEGGITTRALVSSWGQIQESVTGALSERRVSDFALTCIVDADDPDNLDVLSDQLEGAHFELYLWFLGLDPAADPPQLMFAGVIDDVTVEGSYIDITVQDDSVLLESTYVGHRLNLTDFYIPGSGASTTLASALDGPTWTAAGQCGAVRPLYYSFDLAQFDAAATTVFLAYGDINNIYPGMLVLALLPDNEYMKVVSVDKAAGSFVVQRGLAGAPFPVSDHWIGVGVTVPATTNYNGWLSAAVTSGQTVLPVGPDTDLVPIGSTIFSGGEKMVVTAKTATTITVTRGAAGTTAQSHPARSNFYVSSPSPDSAGNLTVPMKSGTNMAPFSVGDVIRIDSEELPVASIVANTLTVSGRSGPYGHNDGSTVYRRVVPSTMPLAVASAAGINVNNIIRVDQEQMQVVGISGTTVTVSRGYNNTSVVAHSAGATVTVLFDAPPLEGYPNTDPDDIGKVIPIPFGVVKRAPSLAVDAGAMTTLSASATAGATSLTVTDVARITTNTVWYLEDEQVLVSSINVTTRVLTVTRGYGGTTAVAHNLGASLIMKKSSGNPYVYLLSDIPLTSVDRVYLRRDATDTDVTGLCTRYTGQPGNQLPGFEGKACVAISDAQAAQIRGLFNLKLTDPDHNHGSTLTKQQFPSSTVPATSNGTQVAVASISFPSVSNIVEQSVDIAFNFSNAKKITVDGSFVIYNSGVPWTGSSTYRWTTIGTGNGTSVRVESDPGVSVSVSITAGSRTVEYSGNVTTNSTGVTLTGNSAADMVVGGAIVADMTSPITTPAAVLDWLFYTYAGRNIQVIGTIPTGYLFNGVITSYEKLLDLAHRMAFQCRCWFSIRFGIPTLIVRDAPSPVKSIAACAITERGEKIYRKKKTRRDDVINVINLYYDRNPSESRASLEAYQSVLKDLDALSYGKYGKREVPELFLFDFVTSESMAQDLLDYYLAWYAVRRWRHELTVYLDHSELEFPDAVTLDFAAGDPAGTIMEARFSPGSADEMDTVTLVIEG